MVDRPNWKVSVRNIPDDMEILQYLMVEKLMPKVSPELIGDMSFYKIPIEELNLPPIHEMLSSVNQIASRHNPIGWNSVSGRSESYRGFSLTYNKDYIGNEHPLYQTMGSDQMTQAYSRSNGMGLIHNPKHTYYDSYGFRHIHPDVKQLDIFDRFMGANSRGRVAFVHAKGVPVENDYGWHVDEFPYHLLRINIPLQTSPEHVLEIEGGGVHHLEVGYAYIWNTRVPHRVTINREVVSDEPRIHIVMGILPWLEYDEDSDSFSPSRNYGIPVKQIVEDRLFLRTADQNRPETTA